MIRNYGSTFRFSNANNGANILQDFAYWGAPASGTTPGVGVGYGATQVDTMPLQPPSLARAWSMLGITMTAQISLSIFSNAITTITAAKFGKILAGAYPGGQQTGASTAGTGSGYTGNNYFNYGLDPLPLDMSGIGTLFDPDQDNAPPLNFGYTAMPAPGSLLTRPVGMFVSFPQPIPLIAGSQMALGVWVSPSVLVGFQPGGAVDQVYSSIKLQNVTYNVTYDDGT